jgi:hypothetical protein
MDTARFSGDVGKAAQQMSRLTAEAGKIGAAISASIGAGLAVVGSLVKSSIDAADATTKLASSIGMTTEEVSRYAYAAELAGVSQEELGSSVSKLARTVADAAAGGKSASDVFASMGISVRGANGQVKSSSAILAEVADRFASYEDGIEKTALAQELFGKGAAKLIPFLNQGSAGLAALGKEADALGITLTDSAGRAAEEFNDNLKRLQKVKEGLGLQIAQKLLPTLESLTKQLFDSAKNSDAFGRAAEVAVTGVKLLISSGAILVGVFKTIGDALGGIAAAAVALFQGEFKRAASIAADAVSGIGANIKGTASTVAAIWEETGKKVEGDAPKTGGKLAAPIVLAAEKVRKEAKAIKTEAEKIYEQVERRLSALQFDVDTAGASDRIKGLIELTRQGASGEQLQRYLDLSAALEAYKAQVEATAEAERARMDVLREGASLTEKMRTPSEVLADELSRLNRLLEAGAINWETYSRAVFAAQDAFDAAQPSIEGTASKAEEFVKRAKENIQDAFGENLYDMMNGNFTKIGDSFVRLIQRMVAEALAAKLSEALFSGGGGGGFGGFLSAIGGALFGGKAYGGPVSAGRPVLVGEHQPEVFIPSTSGNIVPAGNMGRTVNLTVNVQAASGMSRQTALQQGQQIGEGIQRAMARNG